jgi:hypothetical protein
MTTAAQMAERVAKARDFQGALTISQIAAKLGMRRRAVEHMCDKYDVPFRREERGHKAAYSDRQITGPQFNEMALARAKASLAAEIEWAKSEQASAPPLKTGR